MDSYADDDVDEISKLPTNKSPISPEEKLMVDRVFGGENRSALDRLAGELKDCLIIALLYIILSLPPLEACIRKLIPITQRSISVLILFKALILIVIYWIIKHFYLARRG